MRSVAVAANATTNCPRLLAVVKTPAAPLQTNAMYPFYAQHCGRTPETIAPRRIAVPSAYDDQQAAQQSYNNALKHSKSSRIPGLQAFVAGVWDRQKLVPLSHLGNPLNALFEEFDVKNDGHLTATDIHDFLRSKGVDISREHVWQLIDNADVSGDSHIDRDEFADFIYGLANAELMAIP